MKGLLLGALLLIPWTADVEHPVAIEESQIESMNKAIDRSNRDIDHVYKRLEKAGIIEFIDGKLVIKIQYDSITP